MISIRQLQSKLPWTTHYHRDFRSSPMTHKDFAHALLHVHKAAGKLAAIINDAEHGGSEFKPEEVDPYIADLVICSLRMANTCPGRIIDLESAVVDRIEKKNQIKLNIDTAMEKKYTFLNLLEDTATDLVKIFHQFAADHVEKK